MNCKSGGSGRSQLRMQAQPSSCHRDGTLYEDMPDKTRRLMQQNLWQTSGSLLTPCSLKALTANLPVLFFPLAKSTEPL